MERKVKHEYNSVVTGLMQYLDNGNLYLENNTVKKEFDKKELQEIANSYKGANRIHKPMALLFWQDCKNGQFSNWK